MKICNKCAEYGLKFKRQYNPDEFLEGKPNSLIWIIGLNPKKGKRFKLPSSLGGENRGSDIGNSVLAIWDPP